MGLKLSPKYFLHLFYCRFNIVCRKPLTVYKRAPFKEIFTVLYGQKRTQTMCKTCFETPKEQTRHGLVPKRDSFLFFLKKKTFFVLLSILKIKRILKQNRRQPEFVEAASPHGHQPANIGWSSIFVTITIIMVTITILSIIFTITILVFIFIINIIVATIRILFIIVIFNGQDLVALRQFVRIHLGVF